jgi:hypothetical protein
MMVMPRFLIYHTHGVHRFNVRRSLLVQSLRYKYAFALSHLLGMELVAIHPNYLELVTVLFP